MEREMQQEYIYIVRIITKGWSGSNKTFCFFDLELADKCFEHHALSLGCGSIDDSADIDTYCGWGKEYVMDDEKGTLTRHKILTEYDPYAGAPKQV